MGICEYQREAGRGIAFSGCCVVIDQICCEGSQVKADAVCLILSEPASLKAVLGAGLVLQPSRFHQYSSSSEPFWPSLQPHPVSSYILVGALRFLSAAPYYHWW